MPDLISVFAKWWKFILGLSALAVLIAFIACIISPKEYLSTATALPANSVMTDKARIFNDKIQALYSDFGMPDELDKLEGTAALDTIFIATAEEFDLAKHYAIKASDEANYKAALHLKKKANISRSGYNELKVKVWDEDRNLAATLANSLMKKINTLHQHLQNETNVATLQKLEEVYKIKQQEYKQAKDSFTNISKEEQQINASQKAALLEQLHQYQQTINEYGVAVETNPQALLTVEAARASLWPDKPRVALTIILTLAASLFFTFLMCVFFETRKKTV